VRDEKASDLIHFDPFQPQFEERLSGAAPPFVIRQAFRCREESFHGSDGFGRIAVAIRQIEIDWP
jgi:hypothetical protein